MRKQKLGEMTITEEHDGKEKRKKDGRNSDWADQVVWENKTLIFSEILVLKITIDQMVHGPANGFVQLKNIWTLSIALFLRRVQDVFRQEKGSTALLCQ